MHVFRGAPLSPSVGTPSGIAYHDDSLYICDINTNCLHVWNPATGSYKYLGSKELRKPVSVAVDGDGAIYVADSERGEVVAFDDSGELKHRYRPADRTTYKPVAVEVFNSRLFVADMAGHRIDVFSTETREWICAIGQPGSATGELYYPSGLAIDKQGRVYVSDMMNSRVQVFDGEGNFIRSIGQAGNRYGDLGKPKDIAAAPDGTIFIADAEFGYVHLFDQEGRLLMLLGGPGDKPGDTPWPNGVAITTRLPPRLSKLVPVGFHPAYYVWVSNMTGPRRLSLYVVGLAE